MKIPTLIPKPVASLAKRTLSGSALMVVYRVLLITATVVLLYAAIASSPGFLIAFLITSVIAAWFMDDILATISAIWNARFYEISI